MDPVPVIAESARKHDIADEDMIHAFHHPVRVWEMDEGMEMFIGAGRAGGLLEVGVVFADDSTPVIVHAMPARLKFRR